MTARTLNLVSGIGTLLAAVAMFLICRGFPERAAIMPTFIACIMGVASITLILKSLRRPRTGGSVFAGIPWRTFFLTAGAWLALIFLAQFVNFFVLVAIFLLSIALLLQGKPKDGKETLRFLAFSVGISLALWLLFAVTLNVRFPVTEMISF